MAISTGLGIALAGAGALGGAAISSGAAKKAGQVQAQAGTQAAQLQAQQFQQTRADLAPWRQTGAAALSQYAGLLGVGGQPATTTYGGGAGVQPQVYSATPMQPSGFRGRVSDFGVNYLKNDRGYLPRTGQQPMLTSQPVAQPTSQPRDFRSMLELYPSYQFALEEGLGGIERTAAARGGLLSGRTLKAAQRFGTGLAGQLSENYLNRLAALSGVGQTTAIQTGQLGQQAAGQQAQALGAAAAGRASGYLGAGQAWGQGLGQLGTLAGYASAPSMQIAQNPNLQQYVPQAWGGIT